MLQEILEKFEFFFSCLPAIIGKLPCLSLCRYLITIFFISIEKAEKYPRDPLLKFVLGLAGDKDVGLRSDERISLRVLK
jgi:hypothetical protein